MEMSPAAMSEMNMGTKNGDTRLGPFSSSRPCCSSKVWMPPIPLPTITPKRSGSTPSRCSSSPASRMACTAVPMANWLKRSVRFTSLRSMYSPGSKSFTSQAKRTSNSDASNCVMGPAPLRPPSRAVQELWTSSPTGVIRPVPVITTRRFISRSVLGKLGRAAPGGTARILSSCGARSRSGTLTVALDVIDGVAHRAQLLGLLVGNLHPELLLEGHHPLHGLKRVRAKALDERRLRGDLLRIDAELVADDFLDLRLDVRHCRSPGWL